MHTYTQSATWREVIPSRLSLSLSYVHTHACIHAAGHMEAITSLSLSISHMYIHTHACIHAAGHMEGSVPHHVPLCSQAGTPRVGCKTCSEDGTVWLCGSHIGVCVCVCMCINICTGRLNCPGYVAPTLECVCVFVFVLPCMF